MDGDDDGAHPSALKLVDDILDYTEDQQTIGKPAGNDLRQGMVTLPLIYALQEPSSNGYHQQVQELLNQTAHKEEDVQAIVNWVVQGNGIKKSLLDAHTYTNKAREALYQFPASPDRDVLDELIDFVLVRKQ